MTRNLAVIEMTLTRQMCMALADNSAAAFIKALKVHWRTLLKHRKIFINGFRCLPNSAVMAYQGLQLICISSIIGQVYPYSYCIDWLITVSAVYHSRHTSAPILLSQAPIRLSRGLPSQAQRFKDLIQYHTNVSRLFSANTRNARVIARTGAHR